MASFEVWGCILLGKLWGLLYFPTLLVSPAKDTFPKQEELTISTKLTTSALEECTLKIKFYLSVPSSTSHTCMQNVFIKVLTEMKNIENVLNV